MSDLLPLLPITALRQPTDRFRCVPYAADISARTCITRQQRARAADSFGERMETEKCRACSDGPLVAERVSLDASDAAAATTATDRRNAVHRAHVNGGRTHGKPEPHRGNQPVVFRAAPAPTTATTEPELPMPKKTTDLQPCTQPGCSHLQGRIQANTDPKLAPFCPKHRIAARDRARSQNANLTTPPKSPKPKVAAKSVKSKPVKVTIRASAGDLTATLDRITRAFNVIESLGGIEKAEACVEFVTAMRAQHE